MTAEGLGCILPEDYIIVVFRYGMAQELLWRVSWALNVIGHNVVDLSDFDWLTAIRRQRREMYDEHVSKMLWTLASPPLFFLLVGVYVGIKLFMLLLFVPALQTRSWVRGIRR